MYGPTKRDNTIRVALLSTAIAIFTAACALAFALAVTSCTTLPDGRRGLHPGARAVLDDVLACGIPLLGDALAGKPDYIAASRCHLERVGQRLGHAREAAPVPTVEHGRDVVRAAELEQSGERREAEVLAFECESTARERLGAGEGGQQ